MLGEGPVARHTSLAVELSGLPLMLLFLGSVLATMVHHVAVPRHFARTHLRTHDICRSNMSTIVSRGFITQAIASGSGLSL